MRFKLLVAALVAVSMMAGCYSRIGDFTILSTKNFDKSASYKKAGRYSGDDNPFFGVGNIKTASDEALEEANGGGVYMTNVVLEQGGFPAGFRVTGDVYVEVEATTPAP